MAKLGRAERERKEMTRRNGLTDQRSVRMEVSILNALIEIFCLFSIDGQKHVNRVQYAYHHLLFGLICIDSELIDLKVDFLLSLFFRRKKKPTTTEKRIF